MSYNKEVLLDELDGDIKNLKELFDLTNNSKIDDYTKTKIKKELEIQINYLNDIKADTEKVNI